jgi:hypothetical protein
MRTQHQGPSVERIMEKAMPLFQKLTGVTMADLVHFYDNFQKTGSIYLLPVSVLSACWGTEELGWNERSWKKLRDVR